MIYQKGSDMGMPLAFIFALSGLLRSAARISATGLVLGCMIGAASAQNAATERTDSVWPPPFMSQLPKEYLARLHDSLELHLSSPHPSPAGRSANWGYLNFAIAALLLGRDEERANWYLSNFRIEFRPGQPHSRYLLGGTLVRLLLLFNNRNGLSASKLQPEVEELLLEQLWQLVSRVNGVCCSLEEMHNVWALRGAENLHIQQGVMRLMAAQLLKEVPKYASRRLDNGDLLAENYERWRSYFIEYINERAKKGMFVEVGSPAYEKYTFDALLVIADFAADEALKLRARMLLDVLLAQIAQSQVGFVQGGALSRVYRTRAAQDGRAGGMYSYARLLTQGPIRSPLIGILTSSYYPSSVVVSLLSDNNRGSYSIVDRKPGVGRDGNDIYSIDPSLSVARYTFVTPNYIIGTANISRKLHYVRISSQNRWSGVVFRGDSSARIYPRVGEANNPRVTHNEFLSCQDRNVTIFWKNGYAAFGTYVVMSGSLDERRLVGDWLFAREGQTFIAANASGGFRIDKSSEEFEESAKANTPSSPIIMIVNDSKKFDGSFEKFIRSMSSVTISINDTDINVGKLNMKCRDSTSGDGRNLATTVSPYVYSKWNSGVYYLRSGKQEEYIDFSNPIKPRKVVDGGFDYRKIDFSKDEDEIVVSK